MIGYEIFKIELMIKQVFILILLFISSAFSTEAQVKFNGNFEDIDNNGKLLGWDLTYDGHNKYDIRIDSTVKRQGKYSVLISSLGHQRNDAAISYEIPNNFKGKKLMLVGTLKTKDVSNGSAGLWMRVEGANNNMLAYTDNQNINLHGSNDWKEYMIELRYDQRYATKISFGAFLYGEGNIWVDSVRLYLDNIPIQRAKPLPIPQFAADQDHRFEKKSNIDTIELDKTNIIRLKLLGEMWGFLKYHHPNVMNGSFNWDASLFDILPLVLTSKNNDQFNLCLIEWVNRLGNISSYPDCNRDSVTKDIAVFPTYGTLFNNKLFNRELHNKLLQVLNKSCKEENFYVTTNFNNGGMPVFTNENPYYDSAYPDVGLRLLGVFRYWSMVQYYFPSRELITTKWDIVLEKFIPKIIKTKNKYDYNEVFAELIANINDTHANIQSVTFQEMRGAYRQPFKAKFVENRLVVVGYYKDTLNVKTNFKIGDVIEKINGMSIKKLSKQFLPIVSASNFETIQRELPRNYLLRSIHPELTIQINRNGRKMIQSSRATKLTDINFDELDLEGSTELPPVRMVNSQIAYIHARRFDTDIKTIEKQFFKTKGIIIDLRTYPKTHQLYYLCNLFKAEPSAFVRYSYADNSKPGQFYYSAPLENGIKNKDSYKGKLVILVNSETQSQAEFTTMAFQSADNTTIIGSQTAGADGPVSEISLPGRITTFFSGVGIYYPDKTNTQRLGPRIDIEVKPTLTGIKMGKDEQLEKAIEIIERQ